MSKLALFTILLTSGCTSTMVTGIEDGGIASGSSGSTGQGSNVSGSTNTGGAGSATGQVAGLSVSSAGTSGGAATTGGCLAMDATCASDSDCCSGACLNICRSPVGQGCDAGHDCSSGICSDDVCACTAPAPNQETYCASDADCCNAISCQTYVYQGVKYGQCCNPVGGACQGDWDCCDSSCVNGACACLPVEGSCSPGDCCQGACIGSSIYLGNTGACLNPAGDPCNGPGDCLNSNCVNGSCGNCSASTGGICQSTADCCSGAVCAENLVLAGGFPPPQGSAALDAGFACCGELGSDCDGGENSSACCSGQCSNGVCTCARTSEQCYDSQSCCAGGECMPRASGGSGPLACCQTNGQFCVGDTECCSGNCQRSSCACVAQGGACSYIGFYAAEGPAACCSGSCSDAGACL